MKRWQRMGMWAAVLSMLFGLALTGAPAINTARADNVVTITYMHDWPGQGEIQFNYMINLFNKTHPNIQVKPIVTQDATTKFLTDYASGQAPDLLWWDRWKTALYAPKGVFQPIDAYMKQDHISPKLFYGQALKELTWNHHLYGLPATVDARVLFYNKTLLAQAHVKPPRTWAELEKAAIKLTVWNGDKLVRSGFSLQDPGLFNMYLQQAGGHMVTKDGQHTDFNNKTGLTVLNFWNRLLNKDRVYENGFEAGLGQNTDAFVTGKEAMLYTGPWMISSYLKYGSAGFKFGEVPPPVGPTGHKGALMGGLSVVMSANSKHKKEAWEFMKWWLASPQNALTWGKESQNIPGNVMSDHNAYYRKDPVYKPVIETLKFAKIRPTYAGYFPMEANALIPQLQLFMEGKQSAQATLHNAQQQGDSILQHDNNP
jgi:multiple sugar transport system substrate-binding protein